MVVFGGKFENFRRFFVRIVVCKLVVRANVKRIYLRFRYVDIRRDNFKRFFGVRLEVFRGEVCFWGDLFGSFS